ncbi:MAG: NUDIX hydrolase [Patescibacteria group bacterium]
MIKPPASKDFPDSFFRVAVKGLCVQDGKVLIFKEDSIIHEGKWELPGGGLDFGEDPHTGLRREIEEEAGLKVKTISKNPVYVWTCHFENKREMDWYYSLVLCYRIELENLDFTPTDECVELGFFSKEDLDNLELCHQTKAFKGVFDPKDFI